MIIFLIILIILIIIYSRYYLKYNNDVKIIQLYLDNIKLDNLYEKYPIVIYDQIYNPSELLKTIFAYSTCFSTQKELTPAIPLINNNKYLLIYNLENNIDVNIINPKYINEAKKSKPFLDTNMNYVAIKLKAKQVLILPSRWIYQSYDNLNIIQLNDLLSIIILRVF